MLLQIKMLSLKYSLFDSGCCLGKELLVLTFCFTILVNFKVEDCTDGENSLNPDVGPGIMLKAYPSDLELPSKSVCTEEGSLPSSFTSHIRS
ncbi:hypothetical protein QJS04_geneDACA015854 [Acorus gramineus]|uniref:Uncharacterized protein n=1 Tax=Acorus gramineus TaxID=55184 RepID=A0AAV9BPI3_ACOGR|nr:hypothetical protein QJS04_geneDACA015854 [Acorus gramineus]